MTQPREYQAYIGFWCTPEAREKIEALARDTRRRLSDVMRLLIDRASVQVVEISLERAPAAEGVLTPQALGQTSEPAEAIPA